MWPGNSKSNDWDRSAFNAKDEVALTSSIKVDPLLKSLRQNPRYIELLKKMRLPL